MKNYLLPHILVFLTAYSLSAQVCGYDFDIPSDSLALYPQPSTTPYWDVACVGEPYEKNIAILLPDSIRFADNFSLDLDSVVINSATIGSTPMTLNCGGGCSFLEGSVGYFSVGYTPTTLGADSIIITATFYFNSTVIPEITAPLPDTTFMAGVYSVLVGAPGSCSGQLDSLVCFSAIDTAVCDSTYVKFLNGTFGTGLSYNWSFPGGEPTTSTEISPSIFYPTVGNYEVSLIVSDGVEADTFSRIDYINVTNDSTCYEVASNFTAFQQNICDSTTIDFTNASTGRNATYYWAFPGGEPSSSTAAEPSVFYPLAGDYAVTLITSNEFFSDTLTRSDYIHVYDETSPYCAPAGSIPINGCGYDFEIPKDSVYLFPPPSPIAFYDEACVGTPYQKNFALLLPDSAVLAGLLLDLDSTTVNSATIGSQSMTLNCPTGCSFSANSIGYFSAGYTPTTIGVDSIEISTTFYFNSTILPQIIIDMPDLILEQEGQYHVWVKPTGTCTSPITGPVCFSASESTICDSTAITFFNGTFGTGLSYNWLFPGGEPATSTEISPTIFYPTVGNYDVSLMVSDGVETDTLTRAAYIEVYNNAFCYAVESFFTASERDVCDSTDITFSNLSVGRNATYYWEFPGGIPVTSTEEAPTLFYPFPGNYSVTLITSNDQFSDTLTRVNYITVYEETDPVCASGNYQCIDYSQIDLSANCSAVAPVCGCDGIEYPNACIALNCFGVVSWTEGPCANGTNNGGGGVPSDSTCNLTVAFSYTGILDSLPTFDFVPTVQGGNGNYLYYWDFGDGSSAQDSLASHTYNLVGGLGAYNVCLEVFDLDGCFSFTCETIVVDGTPAGNIAGRVTEGTNLKGETPSIEQKTGPGDPLPNTQVNLLAANGMVLETFFTNNNGEYFFDELLFGNYSLQVAIPNVPHLPTPVKLDPTKQFIPGLSFEVNSDGVTTTGIAQINGLQAVSVLPNPTNSNTRLILALAQNAKLDIHVRNVLGQTVFSTKKTLTRGTQELTLPSKYWDSGIYLISIQSSKGVYSLKLLKN